MPSAIIHRFDVHNLTMSERRMRDRAPICHEAQACAGAYAGPPGRLPRLKHGQVVRAEEHFAATVRLRPQTAEAHCGLGVVLASEGKAAEVMAPSPVRVAPPGRGWMRDASGARSRSCHRQRSSRRRGTQRSSPPRSCCRRSSPERALDTVGPGSLAGRGDERGARAGQSWRGCAGDALCAGTRDR